MFYFRLSDPACFNISLYYFDIIRFISSSEPLGSLVSLWYSHGPSSVYCPFSVVRPRFSKIFFSKTAGPIKAKEAIWRFSGMGDRKFVRGVWIT